MNTYEPNDEDLDSCPYDYPANWIARYLDGKIGRPPTRIGDLPRFMTAAHAALTDAVGEYAEAVMLSDPEPDKSDAALAAYRTQFVVTATTASDRWDSRTLGTAVVLAVASGPFFALALVLWSDAICVRSLGRDDIAARVTLI